MKTLVRYRLNRIDFTKDKITIKNIIETGKRK